MTTLIFSNSFGQEKNCRGIYEKEIIVPCSLTVSYIKDDTCIAVLTPDCNSWKFPSTADGVWKIYNSDSATISGIVSLYRGRHHGRTIHFNNNRTILQNVMFRNDSLDGEYKSYYDNGKLYMDGTMRAESKTSSRFTGSVYKYWDNGNIASKEFRIDTESFFPIRTQFWNPDGKEINESEFKHLWDCK